MRNVLTVEHMAEPVAGHADAAQGVDERYPGAAATDQRLRGQGRHAAAHRIRDLGEYP